MNLSEQANQQPENISSSDNSSSNEVLVQFNTAKVICEEQPGSDSSTELVGTVRIIQEQRPAQLTATSSYIINIETSSEESDNNNKKKPRIKYEHI
jgi:hypothetical protein